MRSSSEFDVQEKALLDFINLDNFFTSPKLFSYRTSFFFFFCDEQKYKTTNHSFANASSKDLFGVEFERS
jgi:hypothetical protein